MSQEEIERMLNRLVDEMPEQQAQPPAEQPPAQQPPMQQMPVQQQMPMEQMPMQQMPMQQMPMQQMPMGQMPMQQMPMGQMPMGQMPMQPGWPTQEPKRINANPVQLPVLDAEERLGKEQADNLEMIMSVPLEISVEIGRTQRKVEEILSFSKGSLVVLDKLAGDQVDLFVNGLCVARGDVVVIDDNFGVRITEVLKRSELFKQI